MLPQPWRVRLLRAPTASAADAVVNVGGTTTLTASGAGGTYTWYDAASGGN